MGVTSRAESAGKSASKNQNIGNEGGQTTSSAPRLSPEAAQKLNALLNRIHEILGKVVLALVASPRYRHCAISDLQQLVLDPLMREKIAIAHSAKPANGTDESNIVGIAIWASVSDAVHAKIREQVKTGAFPIRLAPDDWASGEIKWLLDVLAPTAQAATAVLASFNKVVKEGEMHIHPMVARQVDPELLKKLGVVSRTELSG